MPISNTTNNELFLQLIASRHCTRKFDRNKHIEKKVIENIISAAQNAPSSQNNQPWRCRIFTGKARDDLSLVLLQAFDKNTPKTPDYKNRATTLSPAQQKGIYDYSQFWFCEKNGLAREDQPGRNALNRRNYEFYDAPVVALISTPKGAVEGTFLDIGCFIQNILLGCAAIGLGAVPQYSVASYANIIRDFTDFFHDQIIICAVSIGYAAKDCSSTTTGPPRNSPSDFVSWQE